MIEYLAQHLWQMWAVVAVVCLILELTAGDFFIICFSIGSVFAAITAALGGGIYLQLLMFAGRVQIDGDIWKAVTNEPADIPEGRNVRVVGRESTIITVVSE